MFFAPNHEPSSSWIYLCLFYEILTVKFVREYEDIEFVNHMVRFVLNFFPCVKYISYIILLNISENA
jgi:hypothetical protein